MDYWVCLDKQERRRYELTGQRMKRAEDESTDLDCSMQMSDYWSSPDTGYWSSPVVSAAVPASSMNNVVGRNLNSKLYALRSVVPNITKMDKVSILKDAVKYIQKLREQERRMLAEISILESAPEVHGHGELLTTTVQPVNLPNAGHAMPPVKKTRSPMSFPSAVTPAPASAMAAASPPVEVIEVRVTGAGDKLLVVRVEWRHRKGAMGKVCRALEGLRLAVISANIMAASRTVTYTALVQRKEIDKSEMKELIETAIAQVDVAGNTLSTMSY